VSSGKERGPEEWPEGEEIGLVPPPAMTGMDELPLFRGRGGEQRWEEDYHKR
jgi:hypothetical protein